MQYHSNFGVPVAIHGCLRCQFQIMDNVCTGESYLLFLNSFLTCNEYIMEIYAVHLNIMHMLGAFVRFVVFSCTKTKMSSFWNFHHWLHWKLSFWQLSVQPVMIILWKWRHFRFNVQIRQQRTGQAIIIFSPAGQNGRHFSQTTFSNAFSLEKHFVFWFKFNWSLFLRGQLTISQHWFRYWLCAEQVTSYYLNQCCSFHGRIHMRQ